MRFEYNGHLYEFIGDFGNHGFDPCCGCLKCIADYKAYVKEHKEMKKS